MPSRSVTSSGLLWNVTAMVSTQGTTFVVNIVTANLLGRSLFGEFATLQSTQFALASMAQCATWITASKFVAEFRLTDKQRASRVLGLCALVNTLGAVLAAILLFFASPWIARHVFDAPKLSAGLMITAGAVLFSTMNLFQLGALVGMEANR